MGEWDMGTIIGDYIGTTIGIHSPIPYQAPDSLQATTPSSLTRGMARRSLSTAPVRLEHILLDFALRAFRAVVALGP